MSVFGRKLAYDNQTLFRKGMSGLRTFGRKYGSTIKNINSYAQPILTGAEFVAPTLAPEISGLKYGLNAVSKAVDLFGGDAPSKPRNPRLER